MLQPYSVQNEGGGFVFTADNHASYKALFTGRPLGGVSEIEGFVFDFSFERVTENCLNRDHPGNDPRVRLTLERLVAAFFAQEPYYILSFVCDPNDSRDRQRLRLFNQWHSAHQATYTKIAFAVPSFLQETGEYAEAVGGIIFRNDHPLRALIASTLQSELLVYTAAKTGGYS